jgi:hypothetical protein
MPLFADWCDCTDSTDAGRKHLLKYIEKTNGRAAITASLPSVLRSHYDDASRIADDVAQLGYTKAAALLAERMPRSKTARSGELGEILATELVEESRGYRVPVRRLRYKDGREMALRGDDFIGVHVEADRSLRFAKGESKSRANLAKTAITEARTVLSRDAGRPTPTSILFVADRLMDMGGAEEALGRAIRNEVAIRAVPADRIEHIMFTISGNPAPQALADDLAAAPSDRPQTVIHVRVPDHEDFVKSSYEEALKIGIEELTSLLQRAGAEGARGRLRARGEARAIIRREGVLPEGAPAFAPSIDTDLAEIAFSLLRASLALRESGGDPTTWRGGFARAGNAFEALVQNGSPDDAARGFNRVMGATAYHLAGYSALAFSLMSQAAAQANLAPAEQALVALILRDLNELSRQARTWLLDPTNGDAELARRIEAEEIDPDDVVTTVVTSTIYRALAFFQFALQTGEGMLAEEARALLRRALSLSKSANAVSLW